MKFSKTTQSIGIAMMCLALIYLAQACVKPTEPLKPVPPKTKMNQLDSIGTYIPAHPQRSGDAGEGCNYLLYGDYVDAGIPYAAFVNFYGSDNSNKLGRFGDNAQINHAFTATDAANGVRIVSPNCFQCHAQTLNGKLVVGLGNSFADFTTNQANATPLIDAAITLLYGPGSDEWDAYSPFRDAVNAVGPHVVTDVIGLNTADKLAAVLASHRDKTDLTWISSPQLPVPNQMYPSDVPPWWVLKKKHAMFYTGIGRGDFARIMMASSVLTLKDSAKARIVDNNFADVQAFLYSLEPPEYPLPVDAGLVAQGKTIFTNNCANCHGTYGATETYPNLMIPLNIIGTDPKLAQGYHLYPEFVTWYNDSWFSKGIYGAQIVAGDGYVAPPLDGIWATAPYLHNGSVPTLEDLLNSSQRPDYWERTGSTSDIDYVKMGWNYTVKSAAGGKTVYSKDIPGCDNIGHTFGDALSTADRAALIEYLKTI